MKELLVILLSLIVLAGCTTYGVERTAPDGTFVKVDVVSTRDISEPNVEYERKGQDANFKFRAAEVDNNTEAFTSMFSTLMGTMMQMMTQMQQMTMQMMQQMQQMQPLPQPPPQ